MLFLVGIAYSFALGDNDLVDLILPGLLAQLYQRALRSEICIFAMASRWTRHNHVDLLAANFGFWLGVSTVGGKSVLALDKSLLLVTYITPTAAHAFIEQWAREGL